MFSVILAYAQEPKSVPNYKVLPHMEGEIVPGENYIYCPTFQMAWDIINNEIVKGKVKYTEPCPMADVLNRSEYKPDNIFAHRYYVKAGFAKDKIVETIEKELTEKFGPQEDVNKLLEENLNNPLTAFIALSYLELKLGYKEPFEVFDYPLNFNSKDGTSKVSSFGIKEKRSLLWSQIEIVDYMSKDDFIITLPAYDIKPLDKAKDLTRAQPSEDGVNIIEEIIPPPPQVEDIPEPTDEIILAKIHPEKTLKETLDVVMKKINGKHGYFDVEDAELLKIPVIDFKLMRKYDELLGRKFSNPGFTDLFFSTALQHIKFRLDERGAELSSVCVMPGVMAGRSGSFYEKNPYRLVLDRPFLIALRENGKEPYLVCWIENPTFLVKWEKKKESFVDYHEKGSADANADITKDDLKRKISFPDKNRCDKARTAFYENYLGLKTERVEDLTGEDMDNYIQGYDSAIFQFLGKRENKDVEEHIEKLLEGYCTNYIFNLLKLQNNDASWGKEERNRRFLTAFVLLQCAAEGEFLHIIDNKEPFNKAYLWLVDFAKSADAKKTNPALDSEIIAALSLSEIYIRNPDTQLKETIMKSIEIALNASDHDSVYYILLLQSLKAGKLLPEEKINSAISALIAGSAEKAEKYFNEKNIIELINALLVQTVFERKIPESKYLNFIAINSEFDWDTSTDIRSRERYFAQTVLYFTLFNKDKANWDSWTKTIGNKRNSTFAYIDSKLPNVLDLTDISMNSEDYNLYSMLTVNLCLEVYYRYLSAFKNLPLE